MSDLTKSIALFIFFAGFHTSESKRVFYDIRDAELIFNVAAVRDEAGRNELISNFGEINDNIDEENIEIKSRISSLGKKPSEVKVLQHISGNTLYRCSFGGTYTFALKFNSPQVIADDAYVDVVIGKTDEVYQYKTVLGAIARIPRYWELSGNEVALINRELRAKAFAEFPEKFTPKQKISQKEFLENLKMGQTYKVSSPIDVKCTANRCRGGVVLYEDSRRKCKSCDKGKVSKMIQCKMIWDKSSKKLKWVQGAGKARYGFLLD